MRRIITYIIILAVAVYLLPFVVVSVSSKARMFCNNQIAFADIEKKITDNQPNDSAKAIAIYEYVRQNTINPEPDYVIKNLEPLEILNNKIASCDQQSYLIILLSRLANIDGRLIFLRGNDSVSRHSVCELKIDGKYRMFDSYYHLYFNDNSNSIASVDDIADVKIRESEHNKNMPENYMELYNNRYPYKVFMTNEDSYSKKLAKQALMLYVNTFPSLFKVPFVSFCKLFDKDKN